MHVLGQTTMDGWMDAECPVYTCIPMAVGTGKDSRGSARTTHGEWPTTGGGGLDSAR